MCDKAHRYTVEVIGQNPRYVGTDEDEAVSALLSIDLDAGEEGYAVAEHVSGDATVYCRAESAVIECEASKAADHMERAWTEAVEAFHGDGPYAIANQGF